jgi:glucosamine 6-phosphate synthetase-like amidotransferase/phosphosugar isomerase protein
MCALFGIHDYNNRLSSRQKEIVLSVLSNECEVRGTDATGISYLRNGKLQVYKRPVPAHKMRYNLPPNIKTVMGHTRLTTQGNEKNNYNNHPFYGRVKNNTFALAHNGILRNDKELRQSMKLPKTNIETDSYIAVQIIERENSVSFGSLRKVAETVRGSFVFTVLDNKDNLYFVRGDNPLCIYHFAGKGFYLYASTEDILTKTINRLGIEKLDYDRIPVDFGDILRIASDGVISKERFESAENYPPQSGCYQYPMYIHRNYDDWHNQSTEHQYVEMLKQTSGLYGYSPDDIDALISDGWSPDEIEMILCGDMYEDEEEMCYASNPIKNYIN